MYYLIIASILSADPSALRLHGKIEERINETTVNTKYAISGAVAVDIPELKHRLTDKHIGFAMTAAHCIFKNYDYVVHSFNDGVYHEWPAALLEKDDDLDIAILVVTKTKAPWFSKPLANRNYQYNLKSEYIASGCPKASDPDEAKLRPLQRMRYKVFLRGHRNSGHSGGPLYENNCDSAIGICNSTTVGPRVEIAVGFGLIGLTGPEKMESVDYCVFTNISGIYNLIDRAK